MRCEGRGRVRGTLCMFDWRRRVRERLARSSMMCSGWRVRGAAVGRGGERISGCGRRLRRTSSRGPVRCTERGACEYGTIPQTWRRSGTKARAESVGQSDISEMLQVVNAMRDGDGEERPARREPYQRCDATLARRRSGQNGLP